MFSRSTPASAPMKDTNNPNMIVIQNTIVGGNFRKGLDRLTRMLEHKVDNQVMNAQIRAYDSPSGLDEKPRYS
jgi:hypothetical protein